MVEDKPIVVVTGVSGYIGCHVFKKFLDDGSFRVIGTVRDKDNAERLAPMKKLLGEDIELRNADLLNADSIDKAVEGATYLVHVASPVSLVCENSEDLIKPAVEGTMAALRAAHKHGVKRVVVTSSIAAINTELLPLPDLITEESWSNEPRMRENELKNAYFLSKTMAERAAWAYHHSLPEAERFDLCTICPGIVLGKALLGYGFFSGDFMNWTMMGVMGGTAEGPLPLVEVETVADAHLKCIKVAEAANKRYILSHSTWYPNEMAKVLHAEFASKGWPVKDGLCEDNKQAMINWSRERSEKVLGIEYVPDFGKVMVDMTAHMIELGHLKNAAKTE